MKQIKKGKITVTITVGIACLALATVMFMQFKMVNQTDINELEVMREDELRTELANWKAKYEEAENQYQEKTKKLEDWETPYIIFNDGDFADSQQYPADNGLIVEDGKTYTIE